jgi:tape measure domain-containing protein
VTVARVGVEFDGVSRGAVTAAQQTRAAIRGVGDQADKESKRLNIFERGLRYGVTRAMYATAAGAAAAAGGVAFLGVRFDDLKQRSTIAFTTMLGSGLKARKFLGELQAFAARTPFEFADLIRSSQRLMGMGLAAKQVLPTMTAVGNAVAGIGGSAESMDIATRAIGQIQAKGRLMAEEMMQLNEAGVFSWRDLAREIGTSVPKAMKLVQDGAVGADAFLAAFQQSSNHRFKGMMEQQSHTFGGLVSTIKDNFSQLAGTAMKPLFDLMTRGMEGMVNDNGKLNAQGQRVAHTFGVTLANAVERVVAFFREHWKEITGFIKDTWSVTKTLAVALTAVLKVLDKVANATIGWKTTLELLVALKLASVLNGWTGSLRTFAGAEALATGTAGPKGVGARGLLYSLNLLKGLGRITVEVLIVESIVKKITGDSWFQSSVAGDMQGSGGNPYPVGTPNHDLWELGRIGGRPTRQQGGIKAEQTKAFQEGAASTAKAGGNKKARNQANAIAATAATQLGIPYTWGGPAILGHSTDCSGLTQAVLKKNGISVGRTTYEQWRQGRPVDPKHLQPGDLVFFNMGRRGPEHVGVYIGNDQFIEDPHTGASVRVSRLSGRSGFVGARRYIPNVIGGTSAPAQDDSGVAGPSAASLVGKGTGTTKGAKGATAATLVGVRAGIDAQLKVFKDLTPAIRAQLSPLGLEAEKHLESLRAHLRKGMSAVDLAKTRAGIAKWGKVLRDEISKAKTAAEKEAQAAADALALAFDRQFRDASTGVFRIFDRETDQHVKAFQRDTDKAIAGMRKSFDKQMEAFDDETRRGLQGFVVPTTGAEQALSDFQAARQAEADAKAMADAQASGDPEQVRQLQLDLQERALEAAAKQSRDAADSATEEQQRVYQKQRDDQRNALQEQETAREAAYQEERDATLAAYQEQRDDARQHLQDDLDDWMLWIGEKKRTWLEFLAWLKGRGFAIPSSWMQDSGSKTLNKLFDANSTGVGGISTQGSGGHAPGFARGGRVPGIFVGREDTVLARVSPGETVIDRSLTDALEQMVLGGGMGGPTFNFDGATFIGAPKREAAAAWASDMQDALDRLIGYRNPIT